MPAPDASCPQPTPRPAVLSDGCGWETPCRGGAAPSTQRWRQAGDEDVTRHPCAGTVLRHRRDGGVGREANTVLLAPGRDLHSPQAPTPHRPIAHMASTPLPAPHGLQPCPRMRPHTVDVAVPPSWAGAELSQAGSPQHPHTVPAHRTPTSAPLLLLECSNQHLYPSTAAQPPPQHSALAPPAAPQPLTASPTPALPQAHPGLSHSTGTQCSTPIPACSDLGSHPQTPHRYPSTTTPILRGSQGRGICSVHGWGFVLQSCGGSPTSYRIPTEPPHHISDPAEPPPHSLFQGSPHNAPHRAPTPEPPAAPCYGGTRSPLSTSKPGKRPDTEWRSRPEPAGSPRAPPGAAGPCPVARWSRRCPRPPRAVSTGPDGAGRGPSAVGTCGAHGPRHPRPIPVSAPTRAAPAAPHCPDGTPGAAGAA